MEVNVRMKSISSLVNVLQDLRGISVKIVKFNHGINGIVVITACVNKSASLNEHFFLGKLYVSSEKVYNNNDRQYN